MYQRRLRRKHWLLISLFVISLAWPNRNLPVTYAEPSVAPSVSYNSALNTIYIGSNSGSLPASQPLTVPELATALVGQGLPNLLLDKGGGAWLLKANVVISTTAQLAATSATITELRIDSPPVAPLKITAERGGQLWIDGIKVTAWEGNAIDTNIANGRSYLVALEGGRMDILNSEIAYLGSSDGEPSGISWRERLNEADPLTGSTGSIQNSDIHHNYFGMYSYAAYNVKILHNKFHDNLYYGIDPHTGSQAFEVAFNEVYNNGKHGIIFSRDCINNSIHDNIVHDNAQHGIMMDRGSNNNTIENNTVYNNDDGFAVFQSSNNIIRNNTAHDNNRGIRINATFYTTDIFDDISTGNQVLNNTFNNNKQQGVYLYARADRNVISGNTIISTTVNGIYIKSGGNRIENNLIQKAGVGINIAGNDLNNPPQGKPALDPPGQNNVVISTTISFNSDAGIRILGGSNNRIGPANGSEKGNRIENNGTDGIVIGPAITGTISTGNQLLSNIIRNNERHGISIKDASSARNRISKNSISGNKGLGIKVDLNAQAGILPPGVTLIQADGNMNGTALSGATVEVYSDPGGEGKDYLGSAAAAGGNWTYSLPNGQDSKLVTALQTDTNGNSSAFFTSKAAISAVYSVGADVSGQTTITVTGNSAVVTLADIKAGLGISNTNASLIKCGSGALLQDLGSGKWQLNANLTIGTNVTLNLTPQAGVNELQLCSQQNIVASSATRVAVIQSDDASDTASTTVAIDPLSFIYVRTQNGIINIDGVKVHSWDSQANTFDTNITDGRAYLLAKYAAAMNIQNSELSYLGSAEGESYGVSWRDTNDTTKPNDLRTRVTGKVTNSNFHHNYYGIYTFQAQNMLFQDNQFHDNVRYGFDPHDFTHDVLVENNLAYNNGAHGFIISRGCNNFTIRNNKSYNNNNPDPVDQAQGFMLDPGSPNSSFAQAPSTDNLLENNVAYGNEGLGLRILGSTDNQVRNNHFYQNDRGISIDAKSTANIIDSNFITQNLSYGLVTQDTANNNTISNNTVTENSIHGIYIRSSNNLIMGNTANQNKQAGIAFFSSSLALLNNQVLSNTIIGNGDNGLDLRNTDSTLGQGNLIDGNVGQGIYLSTNASQNSFTHNVIRNNQKFGIQANGAQTMGNTWSQNQIYANRFGGVSLTTSANLNIAAPKLLSVVGNVASGQANPGTTVEVFSDNGTQGQAYEGKTVAGADGNFTFTFADNAQTANLTTLVIDAQGNASIFSNAISKRGTPVPTGTPAPTDTPTPPDGATATPIPGEQTPTPTTSPEATPTPATPTGTSADKILYLPMISKK
ncbi:MAG: right-handed parallel beta-helix repeat-containing protein [Chloroflexi bacterium]|nr:right-handed parallel beta-helix repeat-containing protein [Chloroflexota bacterium]